MRNEAQEPVMTVNEDVVSQVEDDASQSEGLQPLTRTESVRFGIGFVLFSLLWMAAGTSGSAVLLPQRFTELGIGVPEIILGTMNSVGCVFALISNVVFGALSDVTRSRFGKRTPWIVCGGFIAATGYAVTVLSQSLAVIVIGWSIVQVGVNMMIAPAVAVLSDRIPQQVRGTFSALYGGAMIVGSSLGTLIGSWFISDRFIGFLIGVVVFAVCGILTVFIWPSEAPSTIQKDVQALSIREILHSFIPPLRGCRDFYLALFGRLALIFGWSMISGYQLYILQKYCGLNTAQSAAVVAQMSIIAMVSLIVTSLCAGPISDRLGKRKIIVAIGSLIVIIGMAMPWLMPTAAGMLLFAGIGNAGYGGGSGLECGCAAKS